MAGRKQCGCAIGAARGGAQPPRRAPPSQAAAPPQPAGLPMRPPLWRHPRTGSSRSCPRRLPRGRSGSSAGLRPHPVPWLAAASSGRGRPGHVRRRFTEITQRRGWHEGTTLERAGNPPPPSPRCAHGGCRSEARPRSHRRPVGAYTCSASTPLLPPPPTPTPIPSFRTRQGSQGPSTGAAPRTRAGQGGWKGAHGPTPEPFVGPCKCTAPPRTLQWRKGWTLQRLQTSWCTPLARARSSTRWWSPQPRRGCGQWRHGPAAPPPAAPAAWR